MNIEYPVSLWSILLSWVKWVAKTLKLYKLILCPLTSRLYREETVSVNTTICIIFWCYEIIHVSLLFFSPALCIYLYCILWPFLLLSCLLLLIFTYRFSSLSFQFQSGKRHRNPEPETPLSLFLFVSLSLFFSLEGHCPALKCRCLELPFSF